MNSQIEAALGAGAVALTPNRRLARRLSADYAKLQRSAGVQAWESPRILPWTAWLESLWWDAVELGGAGAHEPIPRLITQHQASHAWERIVARDRPLMARLLDPGGTARSGFEAWQLLHAWGSGGAVWREWAAESGEGSEEADAFAHWCEGFLRMMQREGLIDVARFADFLIPRVAALSPSLPRELLLLGFTELSPQQQRFVDALRGAGTAVTTASALTPALAARIEQRRLETARDETVAALRWARDAVVAMPAARVGIAIEDFAQRRSEVLALATEILAPRAWLEGAAASEGVFDVSLGLPLATVPLAAAALDLIALGSRRLKMGRAAALLRSPYLDGGTAEWSRRAAIEASWLKGGRHDVDFNETLGALIVQRSSLADRWSEARSLNRNQAGISPRAWVDAWRAWLQALGWPGDRGLSSDEFQARRAWDDMLASFASLDAVTPTLSREQAIDSLRDLARSTVFQPESTEAPIQIMGVLEAAGMSFDALWVCGLTADAWPASARPNPYLPVHWQRRHALPRSSPDRELEYARALTRQFATAAPRVVFSSAARIGEQALQASALIEPFASMVGEDASGVTPLPDYHELIARSVALEALGDDVGPAIAAGSEARGGSSLIGAQADCPFQAFARFRLFTEPWPALTEGLRAEERGALAHSAMAAFWKRMHDKKTLLALDEASLQVSLESAVDEALASVRPARWRALPAVVRDGEKARLVLQMSAWLDIERDRPGFEVVAVEDSVSLRLAGIKISMRIDRIDRTAQSDLAIIDYKTGLAPRLSAWFEERPRAPQLGLYALAWRARSPAAVFSAAVYAQLRAGEVCAVGLADEATWPGLCAPGERNAPATWQEVEAHWAEQLSAMAAEVAGGIARVAPRNTGETCSRCRRHALCRILTAPEAAQETDG